MFKVACPFMAVQAPPGRAAPAEAEGRVMLQVALCLAGALCAAGCEVWGMAGVCAFLAGAFLADAISERRRRRG